MKHLVQLAAAAALVVGAAAPAHAITFVGTFSPTVNSADPGLVVATKESTNVLNFDLPAVGDSTKVDLFDLYTNETTVNPDDLVAKNISVAFNFTSPAASGTETGTTVGQSFLYGLVQDAHVSWSNGGVTDIDFGKGGVLQVALNDASFNAGLFGLRTGPKHGADIDAEFTLLRAPSAVPEPAAWTLLILGFGLAGAAIRASRRERGGLATA